MKKKVLLATTSVALVAVLAACGSSSSSSGSKLSDVKYSDIGPTSVPNASFATPFTVSSPSTYVVQQGSGDKIASGDILLLNATSYKGSDGSKLGTTVDQQPIMVPITDDLKKQIPELYDVLSQGNVGMTISYASNLTQATDASGNATASPLPSGAASNVEIYTVTSKLLKTATGTEKTGYSSALKSFSIGSDGKASIVLADNRGDQPTTLTSQDMITGTGAVVKDTDTVYAKYEGVRWEDGQAFDGNYEAAVPAQFSLDSVIKGWRQGLAGHTIGSRVLLIIPADLAYGTDSSSGRPTGTLVFVVDILGATPAASSAATAGAAPTATGSASASATSTVVPSESATPSVAPTATANQ